ncbi:MAG: 6-phosphogluconolactonase [Alphaproteobacteria bacterium]|nr:6-phosphogluconolactonase [Alphaproteobacteria bacterium]
MVGFIEYRNRDGLAQGLAALVAGQLAVALADQGRATLVVPGGTTPGPFLRLLSDAAIDWGNVRVMLSDERFVPETSKRSNTRLLRETLLQGPAAAASLVPLVAEGTSPEDVIAVLTDAIKTALPIDVCVLGMGADMHTASLFPGADRLDEALDPDSKAVLLPMRATGAPEPRLTLTAQVLRATKKTHILIAGRNKKRAFEVAEQQGPSTAAPIRAILTGPGEITIHYAD